MTSSDDSAKEFYRGLADNIVYDLTYLGELSTETIQFWQAVGYDEDAARASIDILRRNPSDANALAILEQYRNNRAQIEYIERLLSLPSTGTLSGLIANYKRRFYTRDCLDPSLDHSLSFCWKGAITANDASIIPEIFASSPIATYDLDWGLIESAKNGNSEMAELIIQRAKDSKLPIGIKTYVSAVNAAAEHGHVDTFRTIYTHLSLLLEKYPLYDSHWRGTYKAFEAAVKSNQPDVVDYILSLPLTVGPIDFAKPLDSAVQNGYVEVATSIFRYALQFYLQAPGVWILPIGFAVKAALETSPDMLRYLLDQIPPEEFETIWRAILRMIGDNRLVSTEIARIIFAHYDIPSAIHAILGEFHWFGSRSSAYLLIEQHPEAGQAVLNILHDPDDPRNDLNPQARESAIEIVSYALRFPGRDPAEIDWNQVINEKLGTTTLTAAAA